MKAPTNLIKQGKYECASASLALLLGHTHFNVKRVMGSHGWRNDYDGASDTIMRETARAFGRDLIFVGWETIEAMGHDLPNCIVTIPSANYPGKYHGVTWFEKEVVDPNFGHPTRKFWSADSTFKEMRAKSALILAKEPLSDEYHKELKQKRRDYTVDALREEILRIAA